MWSCPSTAVITPIQEFNLEENTGNGLVFEKYTAKELVKTVKRGLKYFKKKDLWQEISLRIMNENFSWEKPTDEYLDIYSTILEE